MTKRGLLAMLAGCYQEQLEAYQRLMAAATEMHRALKESDAASLDMPALNRLLAQQAEQIDRVRVTEIEVEPLKEKLTQRYGVPEFTLRAVADVKDDPELDDLRRVMAGLRETLEKLSQLAEENKQLLSSRLGEVKEEMTLVQRWREAVRAYLESQYYEQENERLDPRFLDAKS